MIFLALICWVTYVINHSNDKNWLLDKRLWENFLLEDIEGVIVE